MFLSVSVHFFVVVLIFTGNDPLHITSHEHLILRHKQVMAYPLKHWQSLMGLTSLENDMVHSC